MLFSEVQKKIFELVSDNDSSVADYISIAKKIDVEKPEFPEYFRKIRVAFLSNFTLLGLPEVFKARAVFHNIAAETYLGPYNQYAQEMLNEKSDLHKFAPNLIFLILDSTNEQVAQAENMALSVRDNIADAKVVIMSDSIESYGNNYAIEFVDFKKIRLALGIDSYWHTKYKDLGDLRLAPEAFPMFSEELLAHAVAISGATKKCLVLDLDNTLWSGVVGEDGVENVRPNLELQEKILALHKKGVILAINSKNNEADAMEVFEKNPKMILKKNHFAAWQINWQDKAANMRALADEVMLGTDSFVFLDDEPFQRNLVKEAHPEIAVLHLGQFMFNYAGFSSRKLTAEDMRRGEMYAEERIRRDLQSSLKSVDDFIKEIKLEVLINEVDMTEADKFESPIISRISQMTQKTNQFNMVTDRWTEEDVRAYLKKGIYKMWTVEASDRFGHYGTIGFLYAVTVFGDWHIRNLLMSCRILGRGIEKALLAHVIKSAKEAGSKKIVGQFIPTKKNKALCEKFYPDNGFVFQREGEDGLHYEYDLNKPYPYPANIKVNFA